MDNYRITKLPLDKRIKTGPPQGWSDTAPEPGPSPDSEASLHDKKMWDPIVPDHEIPWSKHNYND